MKTSYNDFLTLSVIVFFPIWVVSEFVLKTRPTEHCLKEIKETYLKSEFAPEIKRIQVDYKTDFHQIAVQIWHDNYKDHDYAKRMLEFGLLISMNSCESKKAKIFLRTSRYTYRLSTIANKSKHYKGGELV